MSSEAIRQAVMSAFKNGWTATPQDRVLYGANRNSDFDDKEPWIRISISEGSVQNSEVGKRFIRIRGFITVQCFVAYDAGDKAATYLTDSVRALLQNKSFSGVECSGTIARAVGQNGNWFQVNADTQFYFDDISL